jgi:hypothetical protein
MTRDFREQGLIVEEDVSRYGGTTAVVRTRHLESGDVEFLRWRAERWMKLRHLPPTFLHSPWFVLRHGKEMLSHTFAGSNWRSLLGLEDEHSVFERYRERRSTERLSLLQA